jgi:hypothetical protein
MCSLAVGSGSREQRNSIGGLGSEINAAEIGRVTRC